MSDNITILEQFNLDLNNYIHQKETAQASLNQFIGAIYATEQAIQKITEKMPYVTPTITKLTEEEAQAKLKKK